MLINWFTVTAQAVNFLILVWLLKRFLYRPVLAAIGEREKLIAAQINEAEKKKAEALKEQADFLHKNEEFDRQRATLLIEATDTAKKERERLMDAARQGRRGSPLEAGEIHLRRTRQAEPENWNACPAGRYLSLFEKNACGTGEYEP